MNLHIASPCKFTFCKYWKLQGAIRDIETIWFSSNWGKGVQISTKHIVNFFSLQIASLRGIGRWAHFNIKLHFYFQSTTFPAGYKLEKEAGALWQPSSSTNQVLIIKKKNIIIFFFQDRISF